MARGIPHPDFDLANNTSELRRSSLKNAGWKTFVGDRAVDNRFQPQLEIERWNDELFSIGVPGTLRGGGDSLDVDGNALVWSRGIYTARFYDWTDDPDDEEGNGSFEWELVLASAPPVNSFSVELNTRNIELLYQPALTQAEIDEGAVRPERVVGSYAIYSTGKFGHRSGGTNFQCGKVGHLYRPRVTDNLGNQIWGEWNDDASTTGILTLTVDAAWLASATYPVVIDPTFGYTTAGASFINLGGDDIYAYLATAPENGTGDSIHFYVQGNDNGKGVLTLDGALTIVSNGVGDPVAITSAAWYQSDFSTSPTITSSTSYLIGDIFDGGYSHYYDSGSSGDGERDTTNSYTSPADWGSSNPRSERFSIYLTYTASAAGQPTMRRWGAVKDMPTTRPNLTNRIG